MPELPFVAQGHIPESAIRHWKGMLVAMNHAVSKESMDLLLYLHQSNKFFIGELSD